MITFEFVCVFVFACARRIKELCQQFPHGITDQVIQNDMPHLEPQQRAMAINKLLSLVSPTWMRSSHHPTWVMASLLPPAAV